MILFDTNEDLPGVTIEHDTPVKKNPTHLIEKFHESKLVILPSSHFT